MKFLDEIFAQAAAEAPREMCGLIVEENNEEKYIPCENISTEENQFEIDVKVLGKYQLISKIKYIVHSHYNQNCHPSKYDKDMAKHHFKMTESTLTCTDCREKVDEKTKEIDIKKTKTIIEETI